MPTSPFSQIIKNSSTELQISEMLNVLDDICELCYKTMNNGRWYDFAYNYILLFKKYRELANEFEMITWKTSLHEFVGRMNVNVAIDNTCSCVRECLSVFVNSVDGVSYSDLDIQADIIVFENEDFGLCIQFEDESVSMAFSKTDDYLPNFDSNLHECYFSLELFRQVLQLNKQGEAVNMLKCLLVSLDLVDDNLFDDEDDIFSVYPIVFDIKTKLIFEKAERYTKHIANYAKSFKIHPSCKLAVEDWEKLYKTDYETLTTFYKIIDYNYGDEDARYYDSWERPLLGSISLLSKIYEFYNEEGLCLIDSRNYKMTESLLNDFAAEQDAIDSFFYWLHRSNVIKCGMDASGKLLKQYVDFINSTTNNCSSSHINELLIENDIEYNPWNISRIMHCDETLYVHPLKFREINTDNTESPKNSDELLKYIKSVEEYLCVSRDVWIYFWMLLLQNNDELVYGKKKQSCLFTADGNINFRWIYHIIGECKEYFFRKEVTSSCLAKRLNNKFHGEKTIDDYIRRKIKGVNNRELKELIKNIITNHVENAREE